MKRSLLTILISTLAFSFGLVKAGGGQSSHKGYEPISSPVNDAKGRERNFEPIYDVIGIASNKIICNKKNVYNKREAYAAVHEAVRLIKNKRYVTAGCEPLKVCRKYPSSFTPRGLAFKLKGPYHSFPILPNKQLFKGSRLPVGDLVIFNDEHNVAGIVHSSYKGYAKCLLDDRYTPGLRGFFEKLKYRYRYWRGM